MIEVKEKVELAEYTTFKIGGPAKYFVEVETEDDLQEALSFAIDKNEKIFILSGGSNVLFHDNGFDGVVIHINGGDVYIKDDIVYASAGANLKNVIMQSAEYGLTGWEGMYGIPGNVGGAVRGNAGAFGAEVKDILKSAIAMNIKTGEVRKFNNDACEFEYRNSFFKQNPEWIILSAEFRLLPVSEGINPKELCENTLTEREKRHLQNVACAGSFFKNPIANKETVEMFEIEKDVKSKGNKVPAGWLIEKVGLKGYEVGGGISSNMHPNYIMNNGGATQEDILEIKEKIQKAVKEKFDVDLEQEVTIVEF